jgi:hypothetical protein
MGHGNRHVVGVLEAPYILLRRTIAARTADCVGSVHPGMLGNALLTDVQQHLMQDGEKSLQVPLSPAFDRVNIP